MAQQFSYEEVKAKDSTGFKIIASIVYAKAKELAADCPIADYKVVTGRVCKYVSCATVGLSITYVV